MKEQLFTKIINMCGFEDPAAVRFAELLEQGADEDTLRAYIEQVENTPFEDE